MAHLTAPAHATRWIRAWLILIGLMVYAIILIGGATRLTDSGLSITEWDLIKGALPPLNDQAWSVLFDKYKETTEYKTQNAGMSFAEFRYIFWWEWAHRLFARMIGLVAIAGFVVFAIRKWMNGPLARRLLVLICLGGLQGAIGWWMVASGIGDTSLVDVAPYRLMTHFSLALLIIALTFWTWLDLSRSSQGASGVVPGWASWLAIGLLVLVGVQMAAGALVAGLDAGRTYTDWPLMAGELVPSNYTENLGVRALFESRAATQFNHRLLAYILLASSLVAVVAFRGTRLMATAVALAVLVVAQSVWGIVTLINGAMPISLPLFHQGLGVLVLLAAVRLCWLSVTRSAEPA